MIVRDAVIQNLNHNLKRLDDLHAQLIRIQDLGSQDHHRPITGRRREQGLYNYILSERSKALYQELSEVILRTGARARKVYRARKGGRPVVTHRWGHQFSSQNKSLRDSVRSKYASEFAVLDELDQVIDAHMVRTSYWMPDRPDLQPIIAHECAHLVLRDYYSNLADQYTVRQNASFEALMRDLVQVARGFTSADFLSEIGPMELGREVLADLLGAIPYGPAYLYAHIHDLLGHETSLGLETSASGGTCDISVANYMFEVGLGLQKHNLQWYVRIQAVCTWLDAIMTDSEREGFGKDLIDGARRCAGSLFDLIQRDERTAD